MALEILENSVSFAPGPFDVHMHLRMSDAVTPDPFVTLNKGVEGKAGVSVYTSAAFRSGITGGCAMPNEIAREYSPSAQREEQTETQSWPIASHDRVGAMKWALQEHSRIPMGFYLGIDPERLFADTNERTGLQLDIAEHDFSESKNDVLGLKLWGDISTGGFNVDPVEHIPQLAKIWNTYNPDKPVILHVEDNNVGKTLAEIYKLDNGKDIPIHIAHVSSRQEMQAVIDAKKAGMNVSCEVTIHHLFLDSSARAKIGGYGCMKPTLKTQDDIDFLWANMDTIDIFASDCAPHRKSDKEGENPAFGVTNHSVMLPLLLGAVSQGRLTHQDIYKKFCINPRNRFNILHDDSRVSIDLNPLYGSESLHSSQLAQTYENDVMPGYGYNPFTKIIFNAPMIGRLIYAKAGLSELNYPGYSRIPEYRARHENLTTSYSHLLTPRIIAARLAIENS